MSNTLFIKRFIAGVFLLAALLAVGLPWMLYWVGLYGVDGRPALPVVMATEQDVQKIWRKARGTGVPLINSISPLGYAYLIYEGGKSKPDILVVWWVASSYNLNHLRHKGMGWWHLSGAALTIWLSCNWTSEQIFSKAVEIEHDRAQESNKPI